MIRLRRRERSMDASALASAESWLSAIAIAKLVAAFLVATGVAIEFGGDWVARPFERTVRVAREAEVASLNAETIRLSAEAEAARGEIAKANENAAAAKERTANLERENLEMRQKMAGRRISKEQHDEIVKLLSPEPATFDINVMQGSEAAFFAADILKTLTDAGWTLHEKYIPLGEIWTNLTLFRTDDPAIGRLAAALQMAGIPFGGADQKKGRVTVMVGGTT